MITYSAEMVGVKKLLNKNLFFKCKECGNIIERKKADINNYVCNLCGNYETLDYKKKHIILYNIYVLVVNCINK